jgi:hypothetical protein
MNESVIPYDWSAIFYAWACNTWMNTWMRISYLYTSCICLFNKPGPNISNCNHHLQKIPSDKLYKQLCFIDTSSHKKNLRHLALSFRNCLYCRSIYQASEVKNTSLVPLQPLKTVNTLSILTILSISEQKICTQKNLRSEQYLWQMRFRNKVYAMTELRSDLLTRHNKEYLQNRS